MASIVVSRGLQVIGSKASGITATPPTTAAITSMAVDSGSTAFAAADLTIAASTFQANNFDSTPTRAAQSISHVATFTTAQANFTIRRISLHNLAGASVSSNSTSLIAGIDGQTIAKTTDFSLQITVDMAYTSS